VGVAGELHPTLVAATELPDAPATFHIDLEALLANDSATRRFVPPPRFPSVEYHVNVLAPSRLWSTELLATVNKVSLPWLSRSDVRDVYEGRGVPEGHKRVTVELEFNHPDRSLTHEEVLPLVQTLKTALGKLSLTVEV
jgi:phenylalanyl-tRNA synthetase beta chain